MFIKDIIRNTDYLYRVGGEEFIIIFPHTDLIQAKKVSEKIRLIIEQKLKYKDNKSITVSIGVTQIKEDDTKITLYDRVDKLQYISKNS